MMMELERASAEVDGLRRCMNDLVGLLTLSAMWAGGSFAQIANTLPDALRTMLDVDFLLLRSADGGDGIPSAIARMADAIQFGRSQDIWQALYSTLGESLAAWPQRAVLTLDGIAFSVALLRLGMQGEEGILVAGSRRPQFPSREERLLISVAVNQATVALKEARLLSVQRRLASELDTRVSQRTAELAATNEALRREIAERRRAEAALRDSESNSRLIVDSISGLVAIFTPLGEVEAVNNQFVKYSGLTLEEFKQWATSDFVHPDDLPQVIRDFTKAIGTGEPYDFEARMRRSDGVYRWFQVRGLPFRDASNGIIRWYALLTDIDERRRAEERIRRSEMFLAAGQRISLTGTFSWRIDTDEMTFSEELNRIFEFEDGTAVSINNIVDRIHPDDLAMLTEKMEQVRNGLDNSEYEIRLKGRDGAIKHVRVTANVIHHGDGRLECLGAVQDVTQRRLAEESRDEVRTELARVTRIMSLGTMAASIAHEVNQPLAGIVTNASTCLRMLSADPPNVAGALETARRTIRDGNRAADVIARLRALFRKKAAVVEKTDLNEAAREVVALLWSDLRRGKVDLHVKYADDLPLVSGDRIQLQQVIMNLLRNASEALSSVSDRPRHLVMRTELQRDRNVCLLVEDNGPGFGDQERERLFQAFYTTKEQGMGIGLSVSRSIIESYKGRIWAMANDGPGATFAFSVPAYTQTDIASEAISLAPVHVLRKAERP
ncbi:PAS domain-containing protein [Rhizobium sp. BK376]|uniref:PAS domain-containing protein n=1 Tax=Rhizobium sp. BK376 TaxID=2512149 RepID=UPI0010488A71|nr:PAS domain-containing protein [Rhizobium sp. BK376]TCR92919.1 PAS domain S-box-containing protein [Rhizobium sp. BK376]